MKKLRPVLSVLLVALMFGQAFASDSLPSLDEALASKQDLWGLAAMRQPNGPSYEFFEKLLPPLRYVNAAFHYYPIILSAPGSPQKVRLLSNGSALNPHAELKTWKEKGFPVNFFVGENQTPFGADLHRVNGPHYAEGWLPVVQIQYTNDGTVYSEETFASVGNPWLDHGVAFMRFKATGPNTRITARIDSTAPLTSTGNELLTTNGDTLLWYGKEWHWDDSAKTLTASLTLHRPAILVIASTPLTPKGPCQLTGPCRLVPTPRKYNDEKSHCVARWKGFLRRGMKLEVPESVVNNAWRSLLVGNEIMVVGDNANYSWGNAYERLYEAECGDDVRSFVLFGFLGDTRRMVPPMIDYHGDRFPFHNAGYKLQLLAHYYWLTRDAEFVRELKPHWREYVVLITDGREHDSGLAPREGYCGDIPTQVYSLNSNAAAWRGLRDVAAMLADMGETDEARRLFAIAEDYRKKIFDAVDKSEYRDVKPPFIPIALFGEEKPYDTLTATMRGTYWNLLAPYVIQSSVFGPGSERERAMMNYLEEHGAVLMGMIRIDQHSGLFANENAVDDLYGLRYANKLLQLDEPDRALVCFYGKLAQGMTRDTFIGAEGTGLKSLDEFGRPMYLPPNSSANANFLWTLRYLLVQDWDANDDGTPDTLRLLFATPRAWLEDGKTIRIEHAPTAFGEVSVLVKSRLKHGEVIAEIQPPKRNPPAQSLLRIRLPDGWKILSAGIGSTALPVDEKGTVQLPMSKDKLTMRFRVAKVNN